MSYKEELMSYEDDAEDQFDDYDDYDDDEDDYDNYEDDFDTGLDGLEDEYDGYDDYEEEDDYDNFVEAYEEDMYDDYSKTSIGKIDPNDRTLTVVITNKSGAPAEAVLFGAYEEKAQPSGVTVTIEESSHNEVRRESMSNPFMIAGMKLSVSNPLQFDSVLRITRRTATGTMTSRTYQARNATSPQNFSSTLIDDANFQMEVTGQDSLRVMVLDGVTAVFTFTIKARTNIGNLLKGRNVAELSRTPRSTGLPQLDLLRRKKPIALGMRPKPRRRVRRYYRRPKVRYIRRRRPTSRLKRRR